jgi:hypothetical protein
MTHANSLFEQFIVDYSDDADVRMIVDTIQSDVRFLFQFRVVSKLEAFSSIHWFI